MAMHQPGGYPDIDQVATADSFRNELRLWRTEEVCLPLIVLFSETSDEDLVLVLSPSLVVPKLIAGRMFCYLDFVTGFVTQAYAYFPRFSGVFGDVSQTILFGTLTTVWRMCPVFLVQALAGPPYALCL
jgi:hypothetical protein